VIQNILKPAICYTQSVACKLSSNDSSTMSWLRHTLVEYADGHGGQMQCFRSLQELGFIWTHRERL